MDRQGRELDIHIEKENKKEVTMFEAIIVICWVELGKSVCEENRPKEYYTSSSCWDNYSHQRRTLKNKYKIEKKSNVVSYGGCFK